MAQRIFFDTTADAIAAGYQAAHPRVLEQYRGHMIKIVDTSGADSFGYAFGVRGFPSDELILAGHKRTAVFGHTVTVWTNDLNQVGQPGSFRPMFAPGQLEIAVQKVRDAIDNAPAKR